MIRDEEMIRNKNKIEFYKEKDLDVHLVLKAHPSDPSNKPFRNGKTLKINKDYIIFQEDKFGEIIIYFSEIISVDRKVER